VRPAALPPSRIRIWGTLSPRVLHGPGQGLVCDLLPALLGGQQVGVRILPAARVRRAGRRRAASGGCGEAILSSGARDVPCGLPHSQEGGERLVIVEQSTSRGLDVSSD
jgi:hypothetical protein